MAENRTKIIIETESGNSEQKLKNIASGLKAVGTQSKATGSVVTQSTTEMVASFVALGAKVAAVTATLNKAYSAAREAAAFEELALYTRSATESMGLSFERLAAASQRGANGIADSVTVMKANLKALKGGLNASEEEFGRLWEIANAAGDELGTSIEQTFEQITQAINSGNGRALVQMGVLPENFTRAANAADLLNNRSALLKTVLEQLGKSTDRLNGYGDTAFDKFQQLETAFKDLKMAASEGLVPALTPVVETLTDIIKGATKATEALSTLLGLSARKNEYLAYSKSDLLSTQRNKQIQISTYNQYADIVSGKSNIPLQSLSKDQQAEIFGVNKYNWANMAKAEEESLSKVNEALQHINSLEEKRKELTDQTNQKNAETAFKLQNQSQQIDSIFASLTGVRINQEEINKKIDEENKKRQEVLAIQKRITEEQEKAFKSFANLADTTLPKVVLDEKQMYNELLRITKIAGGFSSGFNYEAAADKINEQAQAALERQKYLDYINKQNSFVQYRNNFGQLSNSQQQNALFNNFISAQAGITLPSQIEIPEATKEGWKAIKQDFSEGMAAAMTQGIVDSDLASALASFGKSQAANYGSQLLGGLLSGGTGGLSGAFATGGAGWGLVAGVAIDYVASNWKKWTGDKHKEETMAAVNDATVRGSNAYLNTYKSELNPYISNEDLSRIYQARSDVWTKGMTVSYKWKDTDWHWLTGSSSYSNTTPQSTYDVIAALEKANELAEKSATMKERELDLLSAQGYDYQVTTKQLQLLSSAVDRISLSERQFNWDNGEKFSIDLSENIQDLKKAYYEALKQYGGETANRKTRAATDFLGFYPYLDDTIYGGTMQYVTGYQMKNRSSLGGLLSYNRYTPTYDQYDFDAIISDPYSAYSYVENASNQLDDRNATRQMLELVKMAGSNQYDLAALQYTDSTKYAEQYVEMLEKSQTAAEIVMKEQERIYLDATQTFEQQSAALQMYKEAQSQYYSAKLEILSQEQAKEEQIKKEEAAANLRRQEQMEALLGFTGEIARTGNNVYILEGADQVGALKEMIQQYGDNPEALAALQAMLSAAQSKAKFGKIA